MWGLEGRGRGGWRGATRSFALAGVISRTGRGRGPASHALAKGGAGCARAQGDRYVQLRYRLRVTMPYEVHLRAMARDGKRRVSKGGREASSATEARCRGRTCAPQRRSSISGSSSSSSSSSGSIGKGEALVGSSSERTSCCRAGAEMGIVVVGGLNMRWGVPLVRPRAAGAGRKRD